jgi:ABC-2 type transport system ATP-binding protein
MTVMVTSHDMAELEQLAGRIVLVDKGRIAYDGDFVRLRREFADRRSLTLETDTETAPLLVGADYLKSEANRHEYTFDVAQVGIASLLQQAAEQSRLIDVETHRAQIDNVIADIYERWQKA